MWELAGEKGGQKTQIMRISRKVKKKGTSSMTKVRPNLRFSPKRERNAEFPQELATWQPKNCQFLQIVNSWLDLKVSKKFKILLKVTHFQ